MMRILNAIFILFLLVIGPTVHAKSLKPALNDVIESLEQLIAIKNSENYLSSDEKANIEVEARKTALNKILELSIEEVKNLKDKLEQFDDFSSEEIGLLNQNHINALSDYESYYESIRQQVNQNIGLSEVVDLARKLKSWRENNYHKKINKIASFVLVFQNQETLKTAENRLNKILRDSKAIKSLVKTTKWGEVDKLLEVAEKLIKEAKKINNDAQNFSLDLETESLIKKATQNIIEAYQGFITLGKLVNNNPR